MTPQQHRTGALTLESLAERTSATLEQALFDAVAGPDAVHAAMRYHLETGGKRLRALIPPWLALNLGGDEARARAFGVAIELVHNGTLVHDDVQDGDDTRRGRPTVWRRFGTPQAINAGSWLMFAGASVAAAADPSGAAVATVQRAVLRVIEGQGLEFELQASPSPTTSAWEAMARAKTGALFRAAWSLGALASVRDAEAVEGLAAHGDDLGLFFQLQDDLLDLLGDKGRGASATDLAEGKISFPVAWAAEHATTAARARLLEIVHLPREQTPPAMVAEALALLHETGAIATALGTLRDHARRLEASPWASATPGLVARVLGPLAHALG
jgi:geranylgeranyl pyrophosphate synthase